MNFTIKSKPAEDWNQIYGFLYESTPNHWIWEPIRWIIWKLEQIRTPKL